MPLPPAAPDGPTGPPARLSFGVGVLLESGLLGVAAVLAGVLGRRVWADLRLELADALWGVAAALPLLLVARGCWEVPLASLRRVRRFLEDTARPALAGWGTGQLGAISLLAGLGEETLFRGLLQGALADWWGPWPALLLASAAFGLGHAITRAYALLAMGVGLYLGGLWWLTGNLLAPMVAHAVYDFAALVWLLRSPAARSAGPA